MSVADGVRRDLERLPQDLRESGMAAVAEAMAERIDAGKGSPSECGKVLIDALSRLRDLAPPAKPERTRIDELADRRRRLRGAEATH